MSVWAKPQPLESTNCRIVFIEDDVLLRDLLKASLNQRFQPESIQEFDTANAGLEACLRDKPDLLITDLRLPDMDGRDVIRRLRARQLPIRVIVLTSYVDTMLPTEMIALGVAGLVDKSSSLDHVERAVQSVLAGGLYFASSMSPVPSASSRRGDSAGTDVGPSVLSERERRSTRAQPPDGREASDPAHGKTGALRHHQFGSLVYSTRLGLTR